MKIKLICCDVFARLAYKVAAESPHMVDLEMFPMLSHNEPDKLRTDLQNAINKVNSPGTNDRIYDRIVLAYGLCGNAIVGLTGSIPMIIPRMHDCCAMFMGSQERFLEVFGQNLSSSWRSYCYMERCVDFDANITNHMTHPDFLKLLNEYGKENADYIWQTLHPSIDEKNNKAFYIRLEDFEFASQHYRLEYIKQKKQEGYQVETVKGSSKWFVQLINGPWDAKFFLELLPGHVIKPIYDMEEVFIGTIP